MIPSLILASAEERMAKDKDDSPLSSNVPRELEVGRGEVRQKFRQHIPKGQGDLLTSKDLFGEIIDELGDDGRAVSREGAASPAPMRADTVSMKAEADGEKVYSIVDLAYSTLLHDSKLNRQVETGGAAPETEPAKADSAYGQYLLLERIATGGMAEGFRAKRRGGEGFEKNVGREPYPPPSVGQQRVRRDVHQRSQDGRRTLPSQYRPDLRSGEDREHVLHSYGVHRGDGSASDFGASPRQRDDFERRPIRVDRDQGRQRGRG